MGPEVNFIDDIVPGKIDWTLKVRVIHLWHVFNMRNQDDLNCIDMVLLDEKCGKIQITIKKHLLIKFGGYIEEGKTYILNKLLVAQNDKYSKTSHKYKLFFMGMTRVCNISAEEIPKSHFDFADFVKIQSELKQDVYCDVIGHIVEKDVVKNIEKNGRNMTLLDFVMEDQSKNRLTCTLWGDHAERLDTYLDTFGQVGPIVLILQMVKVNKYKNNMAVSSAFFGTKVILNDDTYPEIRDYKTRLGGHSSSLTQAVTQMVQPTTMTIAEELLSTTRMTIADLLEASDTGCGAVYAKVIEIELDQGWLYDSCNTCMRRVTQVGSKYACDYCDTMVNASPRFKLQLQVIDDTGSTTFTLFNTIVSMYVGRSVDDLIRSIKEQLEHSPTSPDEFKAFIGKAFLFKVDVSEGNILKGWQTFTVKKITHDAGIIQEFLSKHNLQITNEVDATENGDEILKLPSTEALESLDDIEVNEKPLLALPAPAETPKSKSSGKRDSSAVGPIAFPDLNDMSPKVSSASKKSPETPSGGKSSKTCDSPMVTPDLNQISPSTENAEKNSTMSQMVPNTPAASQDIESIDFSTIDFTSPPPTGKEPKSIVKIEPISPK